MVSASGGHPGTYTSTRTSLSTGMACFSSAGTSPPGMTPSGFTVEMVSTYPFFRTSSTLLKFRMQLIPPKTAQSPQAMRILHLERSSRAMCASSSFPRPPSMTPTSTSGISLMSVIGVEVRSTFPIRSTIRSSISRNDMWHPAQASSHTDASLGLATGYTSLAPAAEGAETATIRACSGGSVDLNTFSQGTAEWPVSNGTPAFAAIS